MVAVYIDPDSGSNSNDGSIGAPWLNFNNLATSGLWDEAYVKRGTIMTVSGRTTLSDQSNKWIGAYGVGDTPIIQCYTTMPSSGWVEVDPSDATTPMPGTNLWAYTWTAYSYWNPPAFINFGTLGAYGVHKFFWNIEAEDGTLVIEQANVPSAYGEYDYRKGSASPVENPKLIVYSVGNPIDYYGTIYYQLGNQPALLIRDCHNITVHGLKVMNSYALARAETTQNNGCTNINFLNIEAELAYAGVAITGGHNLGWVDGFKVEGMIARNMLAGAIYPYDYIRNGIIQNNDLRSIGLVESDGAIYMGNCFAAAGAEVHIRNNYIEDMRFGNFWPHDGGSIMLDSNSSNVWVYQNLMRDSFAGLKSNSGSPGCRWFSNITVDVDQPFQESDTGGLDSADTYVCNNTFLYSEMYKHYERDALKSLMGAVRFVTTLTTPNSVFKAYNNIIGCIAGTDTNAFACEPALHDAGAVTTGNNLVSGHTLGFSVWGWDRGLDASDIAGDTTVGSGYRISDSSPARRAGVDWWTALGMTPVDFYGLELRSNDIDIGAVCGRSVVYSSSL